jgi:hypothetical protein
MMSMWVSSGGGGPNSRVGPGELPWDVTRGDSCLVSRSRRNNNSPLSREETIMPNRIAVQNQNRTGHTAVAVGFGVVGVLAAVFTYWLVVPGVVLGLVAVLLGWRARRDGVSEAGSVAIALGIVAILLVPSVLVVVGDAEDWARDCALDPTHDPNC